jgi:hypothetical protein
LTARQPRSRLRIVGWQIDGRTGPDEIPDRVERGAGNPLVGADTVELAREHQFLVIGSVASEKISGIAIVGHDREMIGRVTGRGDRNDVSRGRQWSALP